LQPCPSSCPNLRVVLPSDDLANGRHYRLRRSLLSEKLREGKGKAAFGPELAPRDARRLGAVMVAAAGLLLTHALRHGREQQVSWSSSDDRWFGLPGRYSSRSPEDTMPDQTRPLRILVTDDNTDAADMLAMVFYAWGHEAHVAYSGESALKVAEANEFHVAIIDLEMPHMSGIEVARRLRQKPGMEKTLLICLTGHDHERDGAEAGFDRHMTKPADFGELRRLLAGRSKEMEAALPLCGLNPARI
jgi:CheY-like chemotaxis protein